MKKGIYILLGMLLMIATVEAKNNNESFITNVFNYSYNNAVIFEDRGVEFFVFTNGEFDFNSVYNRNININRDFRGRIVRIGNSFINYDAFGNVTRIGNVFMRYNRGRLANVGNLQVRYNRWGNPIFNGTVRNNFYNYNGVNINLNIGDICNYNDAFFFRNDFRVNYSRIREDRNFYYYRANPNARIGNRSTIIRRRKPAVAITNRNITSTRKNNTTYRKPVKRNNRIINRATTTNRNTTVRKNTAVSNRVPATVNTKRTVTPRTSTTRTTIRKPASVTKRSATPIKRDVKKTTRATSTRSATNNKSRSRR